MTDVFISYSRRDNVDGFITRLVKALEAKGLDVWFDNDDIPKSSKWWNEIEAGIEAANNYTAIISPDFVRSDVCAREFEYALSKNKRLVPVLHRPLLLPEDQKALPSLLGDRNWVYVRETDDFDGAVEQLVNALRTDLEYVRIHTRLLVRAIEWDAEKRNTSFVLHGQDLRGAETWFSSATAKNPQPTDLHLAYVLASQQAEKARRRVIVSAVSIAALIVMILGVLFINEANNRSIQQAVANQRAADNESLRLATVSNSLLQTNGGNVETAALLALRGLRVAYSPQAELALRDSLDHIYTTFQSALFNIRNAVFLNDGGKIALTTWDNKGLLWDLATDKFVILQGDKETNNRVASFTPDGQFFVTLNSVGVFQLRNVNTNIVVDLEINNSSWINRLILSPDKEKLITLSMDGIVRELNAKNGQFIFEIRDQSGQINDMAITPDGNKLVTGGDDGVIRIFDIPTGQVLLELIGHTNRILDLALSTDGRKLVTLSLDGTTRTWDVSEGHGNVISKSTNGIAYPLSVTYSPDGAKILEVDDNAVRLLNADNGHLLHELRGHFDNINSAVFSPDGKYVVSTSLDKTAIVWDAESGERIATLSGHLESVIDSSFSPDGKQVLTISVDGSIRVWNIDIQRATRTLIGHKWIVANASYSPDGNKIATSSYDGSVRIWDARNGHVLHILDGMDVGECGVSIARFSPDSTKIMALDSNGRASMWDVQSGSVLWRLTGDEGIVISAEFDLFGKRLITSQCGEKDVQIWNADDGRILNILSGHSEYINSVALSPDGRLAVTASHDATARIWDVETGKLLYTLSGHLGWVSQATFSPDGKSIVSASQDGTSRIWDVDSGQLLHVLVGHESLVNSATFSSDGKVVVTASYDGTARIWDAISGKQLQILAGHSGHVLKATFSPDREKVLTASDDHTARLWDAKTGEVLQVLMGHTREVLDAEFSPNGKRIVTASGDSTARIWDTDYHDFIAYACTRVFRDLTTEERQQYGITNNQPTCPQFATSS
ncbi:MAG: TIR domain-containing protein [Anaerolineae bacterium]